MTTHDSADILVLATGLFPDAQTVEAALSATDELRVTREIVDPSAMTTADWDRLVQDVLQADKVVTL